MAYIYLLNLYETIQSRIDETNAVLINNENPPDEQRFLEGRVDLLMDFKEFLSANLDRKLPKRIRKQLSTKGN